MRGQRPNPRSLPAGGIDVTCNLRHFVDRHAELPRLSDLHDVVAATRGASPSHLVTPHLCGQFGPPPQELACQSDLVTQGVRERSSVASTQDECGASAVPGLHARVRGSSSRSLTCATSVAGWPLCLPSGIARRNSIV